MADVVLQGIGKRFGRIPALVDATFDVRDGEFFVLLGPTGAGKTTTLRVVAGLERQDAGTVQFDGRTVDALGPAERDVAFVFQQYSLYPTMSVYDNLAFPLRSPLRRVPELEIRRLVGEAAEKLRLTHLLERKTAHLSGGEMQRVAIGRAIVRRPRIFLMDEPLSNLDAKLREALRIELKHLQKTAASTTLFVTHDQIEALTMADRIAVLRQGHVIQIGTPEDIYDRPATTFVAQLVGSPKINLLPAGRDGDTAFVAESPIRWATRGAVDPAASGLPGRFILGVRPEDVKPGPDGAFGGQVALVEPLGVETLVYIRAGSQTLISTVPGMSAPHLGDEIRFSLAPAKLHYFRQEDGARL